MKQQNTFQFWRIIAFAALILIIWIAELSAQGRRRAQPFVALKFYVETYNLPSNQPGNSQLHVVVDVKHSDLHFLRQENGYLGSAEGSILILQGEKTVAIRDITRQVQPHEFTQTLDDDQFIRFHAFFDLAAGEYEVVVNLSDRNSDARGVRKIPVRLKDFQVAELALSSIMLVDPDLGGSISPAHVIPLYAGSYPDSLLAVIGLVRRQDSSRAEITYELRNTEDQAVFQKVYSYPVGRNGSWLKLPLTKKDIVAGVNTLVVQARVGGETDVVRKRFYAQVYRNRYTSSSIQDRLAQLKFIADKNELKTVMKKTAAEQEQWFAEFWRRHDPTPDTERNELQEEYYTRVHFANKRFQEGKKPGWQTDRGEIYILYGPPDNVERRSSSYDMITKFEIWYYEELGRRFIFKNAGGKQFWLIS